MECWKRQISIGITVLCRKKSLLLRRWKCDLPFAIFNFYLSGMQRRARARRKRASERWPTNEAYSTTFYKHLYSIYETFLKDFTQVKHEFVFFCSFIRSNFFFFIPFFLLSVCAFRHTSLCLSPECGLLFEKSRNNNNDDQNSLVSLDRRTRHLLHQIKCKHISNYLNNFCVPHGMTQNAFLSLFDSMMHMLSPTKMWLLATFLTGISFGRRTYTHTHIADNNNCEKTSLFLVFSLWVWVFFCSHTRPIFLRSVVSLFWTLFAIFPERI